MKLIICYSLSMAVAISPLFGGPKPIDPKKPEGKSSSLRPASSQQRQQNQTAANRREFDNRNSSSNNQEQSRRVLPQDSKVSEKKPVWNQRQLTNRVTLEKQVTKVPQEKKEELTRPYLEAARATRGKNALAGTPSKLSRAIDPVIPVIPSREKTLKEIDSSSLHGHFVINETSINPNYFSLPETFSANKISTTDAKIEVVSSQTRDADLQRKLLAKSVAEVEHTKQELLQASQKTAQNPSFVLFSSSARVSSCVPPPQSKNLTQKIEAVKEAHEDLIDIATQLGAERPDELFSKIEEDPEEITVFGLDQPCREKAPVAQSFTFGMLLKKEFQQLQQKTIVAKLRGIVGANGRTDPFGDMIADLGRAQGAATFSLRENDRVIPLNKKEGKDNLATFRRFVGENYSLQVAIASVMHQGGQSDFEKIKLGVPRDEAEENSLPFFIEGVKTTLWHPNLDGPMLMRFFSNENREEIQSYELEKITSEVSSESRSPIFQLTTTCTQSVTNADFKYNLTRAVQYQFEENDSFNPNGPISEENFPVAITCLRGNIAQSFSDKRTPGQFDHQVAQYNLAVYQERLKDLGDPQQIQEEYDRKINQLAGRTSFRGGFGVFPDVKAVESSLEELRAAQQQVERAQEELKRAEQQLQEVSAQNKFSLITDQN